MNLIPIIVIGLVIYAIVRRISSAARERTQERENERIRAEQAAQREERRRLHEQQREQARRMVERDRMIARQRQEDAQRWERQRREDARRDAERERLRREQERHAAQLAKHEEQICKMQFQLNQATEDIENIQYKIGEQQRYAAFLEEQRDKCVPDSAEYFKWQNKLSTVDDKIFRLDKQRRAAIYRQEQAQRKLA